MKEFTWGDLFTIATIIVGWVSIVIRMDKRIAVMEEVLRRHDKSIERLESLE